MESASPINLVKGHQTQENFHFTYINQKFSFHPAILNMVSINQLNLLLIDNSSTNEDTELTNQASLISETKPRTIISVHQYAI